MPLINIHQKSIISAFKKGVHHATLFLWWKRNTLGKHELRCACFEHSTLRNANPTHICIRTYRSKHAFLRRCLTTMCSWRRRGHANILEYVVNIPSRLKQGWVFVLGHRLSRHLPLFSIDMGFILAWREGPRERRSPSKSFTLHTCFNVLGSARYLVKVLTGHPSQLSTQATLTWEIPLLLMPFLRRCVFAPLLCR